MATIMADSELEIASSTRGSGLGTRDLENTEMPPGQLRWRARRGQRELDLILTRWLDNRYAQAAPTERSAFAALLECSDPDILDWVLGRAAPPAELIYVVRALAASD